MIYSVHCASDFLLQLAEFLEDMTANTLAYFLLRYNVEQETVCVMIAEWWRRLGPCSCTDRRRICIRLKCPDARRWLSALMTSRKTYILTICSAEVLARWLQLIPLLHSILRSPIFMLTWSTSLPSTVTVFYSVESAGALLTEVKILGDFRNSLTTSCLQSCV